MKKNTTQNKVQFAFTLIELLVVATIIIVLATMGLVSYRTAVQKSKQAKCESDMQSVRQALVMYRSNEGTYPTAYNGDYSGLISSLKSDGYLGNDDFSASSGTSYSVSIPSATSFTLTASGDCSVTVTNP